MTKKPILLLVEDKRDWINIFEDIFSPDFLIQKAKSKTECDLILEKKPKDIRFAVVDIRLGDDIPNLRAGLNVLITLKSRGIPVIVASEYADEQIVRDAFVLGGVKDFWFKNKLNTTELQNNVNNYLAAGSGNSSNVRVNSIFWPSFFALVGIPLFVFAVLVAVVSLTPKESISLLISAGIVLSVLLIISFALFIQRITDKQFIEVLKEMIGGILNKPSKEQ
jgi:CheY-like chemotaxis protein